MVLHAYISVLRRQSQEEQLKFEASLIYTVSFKAGRAGWPDSVSKTKQTGKLVLCDTQLPWSLQVRRQLETSSKKKNQADGWLLKTLVVDFYAPHSAHNCLGI